MKNLNQSDLASQLGVTRSYITMLKQGKRQPSKKLQRKLAKLTKGCSLPDTFLGNGVQVVGGSNPLTPTIDRQNGGEFYTSRLALQSAHQP